jgi:hypothetical protein
LWVVKDFKFIAFMNSKGEFYERCGSFNVMIGFVDVEYKSDRKKKLEEWLKLRK